MNRPLEDAHLHVSSGILTVTSVCVHTKTRVHRVTKAVYFTSTSFYNASGMGVQVQPQEQVKIYSRRGRQDLS